MIRRKKMADWVECVSNLVVGACKVGSDIFGNSNNKDKKKKAPAPYGNNSFDLAPYKIPAREAVPQNYDRLDKFRAGYRGSDGMEVQVECSEWLAAALGAGALVTVAGIVYISVPFVKGWIEASKN